MFMCKAPVSVESLVEEYLSLVAMSDDLNAAMKKLAAQIQEYMLEQDADVMESGAHIVRYADVESRRLDTTKLKKELGEATFDGYYKTVKSKRFTVK